MDIKLGFAVASVVALVIGYFPYFRDIFRKTTKPHSYTWLIWAITQGTATAAAFYGGANWGVLILAGGTLLVIFVFLLSFKYGTKNITRSDTGILLSETLAFWLAMAIVSVLTILSLGEINWLTAPYLVVLAILNIVVLSVCAFRRQHIPKPTSI